LLLDTHALLWALGSPTRLPAPVVHAVRDPANAIYASAASIWEISIKAALGKISADVGAVVRAITEVGFDELPIAMAHARRVSALPPLHRDPFDRMLVAQALEEGLTVVTRDSAFAPYRVPTTWQ
jgi:PIN domain nuclease of toxin-antitoxin system